MIAGLRTAEPTMHPMPIFRLPMFLSLLVLAGCSTFEGPQETAAQLALACEMTKCECQVPQSGYSFSKKPPVPVEWRSDGAAYCPAGYTLARTKP
jgi:hypothetical protein